MQIFISCFVMLVPLGSTNLSNFLLAARQQCNEKVRFIFCGEVMWFLKTMEFSLW